MSDNQEYALKMVKIMNLSEKERNNALNEIRILASLRHPNILMYKEAFIDEGTESLWYYIPQITCQDDSIVTEFADQGDLYQKIYQKQRASRYFEENEVWHILIQVISASSISNLPQIVRGLKALHELGIFHRDIKSANVFLFKGGIAKLGDMNVSKLAYKGFLTTQTGTPYYARYQPYLCPKLIVLQPGSLEGSAI